MSSHLTNRLKWVMGSLLTGLTVTNAARMMSMPFLAVYLTQHTQFAPWLTGLIVGLAPFATLIGGFLGGQLSDILGRIFLLFLSIFGTALVFFGFYEVALYETGLALIIGLSICNFLNGFLSAIFQPVSQALTSDLLPPDQRAKAFQLRYAAINLGVAIGPVIGAFIGLMASPIAFLFTGLIYLLYGFVQLFWLKDMQQAQFANKEEKVTFRNSLIAILRDRKLGYFIVAGILFYCCYAQLESTLSQYLIRLFDHGAFLFSWLISLNGITVVAFQYPVYLVIKRLNLIHSMIIGSVILALSFMLFSLAGETSWLYFLAMAIASVGEIFIFPVSSMFIDNIAPKHLRGTYFGAAMLRQLGLFIGPVMGGWLLQTIGGPLMFVIMALFAIASCILIVWGERVPKQIN